MIPYYKSYLRAFNKYAQLSRTKVKRLATFAIMLDSKVNELLARGALNKMIDLQKLQRELLEAGKDYVQQFASLMRKQMPESRKKLDIDRES